MIVTTAWVVVLPAARFTAWIATARNFEPNRHTEATCIPMILLTRVATGRAGLGTTRFVHTATHPKIQGHTATLVIICKTIFHKTLLLVCHLRFFFGKSP